MKIQSFEFNLFGVNTYIIFDTNTCEAAIVDPGMTTERECARIDSYIENNGLHVKYLINTHMHIDHLFGDEYIAKKYGTGISASTDDSILSERIAEQARMFHLRTDMPDTLNVDMPLHDGDRLMLGAEPIDVLAVPGHSPGSIALYSAEGGFVIGGDVLFKGSIGRTDLQGGNLDTLLDSIHSRLMTLPDSTNVLPGHDRFTTIGAERATNPYI